MVWVRKPRVFVPYDPDSPYWRRLQAPDAAIPKFRECTDPTKPWKHADAWRKAFARDVAAAGGLLTADEAMQRLSVSSQQELEELLAEGRLVAVQGKRGDGGPRYYPACQFTAHGGLVEGIRDVVLNLQVRDGRHVLNFLVRPSDMLGKVSPIQALKAGRIKDVVELIDYAQAEY